ncbi:MAG: hypothetical protein JW797_12705 [Bradymonadales bacterium]|nr:hypothetical protein [Bradymonadales bacterium]
MVQRLYSLAGALLWLLLSFTLGCVGDSPPTTSGDRGDVTDLSSDQAQDQGSDLSTPDSTEPDGTVDLPQDPVDDPDPDQPVEDQQSDELVPIDLPPDTSLVDSDDDGILDIHEGFCFVDTDEDSTPDCLDLDSDDDGIPDEVEAGDDNLLTPPVDTDDDGTPDFQDLDSDDDGIFDEVEGTDDPDGNGVGNWRDLDSDSDGLLDSVEGTNDFDDDGIPDYLDPDSDDDCIPDWLEGVDDSDDDDILDRYDPDSDGDGHLDRDEQGTDCNLATMPVDTDEDRTPDFRDLDSDGDGLADEDETGCPASTSRTLWDSDGDTFSDMAEVAVGSNACSAASTVYDIVEFFFILPPDEEVVASGDSAMQFSTDLQQIDIHINMDTTGSMGGEIAQLKCDLTGSYSVCEAQDREASIPGGIINAIKTDVPNSAFGVSDFRDFPYSPFGSSGDYPHRLYGEGVTTTASTAQTRVNQLALGNGLDLPESGFESLYQIASGAGLSCSGASPSCNSLGDIPAYIPPTGRFGGVGFRDGSYPFVIHITDDVSHLHTHYPSSWGTHSQAQAISELISRSIRVLGVFSLGGTISARTQLEDIAIATDARVPVCAFDGVRPSGCGTTQCCTGEDGQGVAPVGGMCPLVFSVAGNGSGLGTSMVDAIRFMAENITMKVTTQVIGQYYYLTDPAETVNSACFITAVQPDRWERDSTCGPTPRIVGDHFEDVTAGTQVFFRVVAENDGCVTPRNSPMLFEATIKIWGDDLSLLDTMIATIIIPPEEPGGPK